MNIAILGFRKEGQAILNFLKKSKEYKNAFIWILDQNKNLKIPKNINFQLGNDYLKNLNKFDIIFRSPGVPYNLKALIIARKKGVKISSSTKLFLEKIKNKTKYIIGITGTKGKGTTSTLIYNILKAAKKDVILAGNIGSPAINYINKIKKNTFVILELSSFQLQDLKQSPHVAIILDIFPDHQDSHKSLKEYFNAKSNICRFQNKNGYTFYFKNILLSKKIASFGKGKKIGVDENKINNFGVNDLKIKGFHNFRNAAMAYEVSKFLKIPEKIILKTIKNFKGLKHRLEFVRKIKILKNKFIEFYNDSASTNPNSAQAAINSFPQEKKIIILGGKDKNLNYDKLSFAIKKIENEIILILLFGENKNKIFNSLKKFKINSKIEFKNNLKEIINTSKKIGEEFLNENKNFKKVIVIFSPAATSFDMFKNYAERGNKFKKLVLKI
jgi:UDP-N-acetylmuramoylalanine--D-glutamate ligase